MSQALFGRWFWGCFAAQRGTSPLATEYLSPVPPKDLERAGCKGEKLFPRCMKNTAWGKGYISINQPTNGTIINVLNAIEVTLPMYG